MALSIIHGVLLTVGCVAVIPAFLRMFTSSENIIDLGIRYCTVAFAFTIINVAAISFEKIFQAVGRMKVTMLSLMCGCIANIILDPVLIFGLGFFPEMGIEGAALATGTGQTLSLIIYLAVYIISPISVKIKTRYMKPERTMIF